MSNTDEKIRLAMKTDLDNLTSIVEEMQTKITQLDEDVNQTVASAIEELAQI